MHAQENEVKICGVNYVSPKTEGDYGHMEKLKRIDANWIAINPFAFITKDSLKVVNEGNKNWFGDSFYGVEKSIDEAMEQGLKVFLKPHFIMDDFSWVGDFAPNDERDENKYWVIWRNNYRQYILKLAELAEAKHVAMFCIGVEFKSIVRLKQKFWVNLIEDVRLKYTGQLTYAANWDNYENVSFWNLLDFISIDAYFPLSLKKAPSVEDLKAKWKPVIRRLSRYSEKHSRKILFAEYGYRSVVGAAGEQWLIEDIPSDEQVDLNAQVNGYQALYESVWAADWFAGGFIWKWWPNDKDTGGEKHSNYSPQNKPVENVIRKFYK